MVESINKCIKRYLHLCYRTYDVPCSSSRKRGTQWVSATDFAIGKVEGYKIVQEFIKQENFFLDCLNGTIYIIIFFFSFFSVLITVFQIVSQPFWTTQTYKWLGSNFSFIRKPFLPTSFWFGKIFLRCDSSINILNYIAKSWKNYS